MLDFVFLVSGYCVIVGIGWFCCWSWSDGGGFVWLIGWLSVWRRVWWWFSCNCGCDWFLLLVRWVWWIDDFVLCWFGVFWLVLDEWIVWWCCCLNVLVVYWVVVWWLSGLEGDVVNGRYIDGYVIFWVYFGWGWFGLVWLGVWCWLVVIGWNWCDVFGVWCDGSDVG